MSELVINPTSQPVVIEVGGRPGPPGDVPGAREIIAGAGLDGGGDLTADRTLSIADGGVVSGMILDDAVKTVKIEDEAVTTPKIADSNVTTQKLNDEAVTFAKLNPDAKKPDELVVFTSNGTFDPTDYQNARCFEVEVIGGGGAGGGAQANPAANQHSNGAGGGSGGIIRGTIPASELTSSVSVTVGAGGTGVSNDTGGGGGSSSFATDLIAGGGAGGPRTAGSSAVWGFSGAQGGACSLSGPLASYCIADNGQRGGMTFGGNAGLSSGGIGAGAGGGLGAHTSSSNQSQQGGAGQSPGAGGGGSATSGTSAAARAGGNGFRGEVRVWVRY